MATLTSNAGNETTLDAFFATRKIKLKPAVLSSLKEDYGIQEPGDFSDLMDEDISSFILDSKLNVATKRRFERAYREIKYGEAVSSPRSRASSTLSRSGSLYQVGPQNNLDDGSFLVQNYRICKDQPLLSGDIKSHCDVLLAETDDEDKTPLVAKISTDASSAAALQQECLILRHVRSSLGTSSSDFIVKLVKMVEQ